MEFEYKDTSYSNSNQERGHSAHETSVKLEYSLFFRPYGPLTLIKYLETCVVLTYTLKFIHLSHTQLTPPHSTPNFRTLSLVHPSVLESWSEWSGLSRLLKKSFLFTEFLSKLGLVEGVDSPSEGMDTIPSEGMDNIPGERVDVRRYSLVS